MLDADAPFWPLCTHRHIYINNKKNLLNFEPNSQIFSKPETVSPAAFSAAHTAPAPSPLNARGGGSVGIIKYKGDNNKTTFLPNLLCVEMA